MTEERWMNYPTNALLVCDLDGTLIHGDLEKAFMKYLIREGLINPHAIALATTLTPINLVCRKLERGSLWKVWLLGLSKSDVEKHFEKFVSEWVYTLSNGVIELLEAFVGHRLLLTGSYEPIVLHWLALSGMHKHFDEIIGCRVYPETIRVERHPYGLSKLLCLKKQRPAISIANEYADRHIMRISDTAVVVGANKQLLAALENHPKKVVL